MSRPSAVATQDNKRGMSFEKTDSFVEQNSPEGSEAAAMSARRSAAWAKMDLTVLPVVTLMYFFSSLDRSNIGNARIAGLQKELNMSNFQYSLALTVALVPFVLVEIPANMLMIRVGPRLLLPTLVCLWGVSTACQGVVHNESGLLACRFFIGLFEGGLPCGIYVYLASFYPRRMLQFRVSIVFSSSAFAGAFSGLLAAAILNMDGEGCLTVVFGLACFFLLPDSPKMAFALNEDEKMFISKALADDGILELKHHVARHPLGELWHTLKQPHMLMLYFMGATSGIGLVSLQFYLPTVVADLGFEGIHAQLLTVPPSPLAHSVLSVTCAIFADRYSHRGLTVILFSMISTTGYALFLASDAHHVRYASLFLTVAGIYSLLAPLGTWVANNTAPLERRATALAFYVMCANSAGILSTWLYGSLSPAPRYTAATGTMLALQASTILAGAGTRAWLARQNKRKAAARARVGMDARADEGELKEMSSESIWFEYVL
ncbi:MFS general substrate transporter [Epithele typhae]|uniref:MFS general substrate transporter n=1 Tax=Epithele typhae TaxID=378194 RepID=UPI002008E6F2|nr:MFS general substrate transporter [Epithele typhae]KAH9917655.1 MFS general substrate transporter [Epithele typhae]